MLVKFSFPCCLSEYPDVDMLRCKDLNCFATECVMPKRPKRCLPPLPEDQVYDSGELKKPNKMKKRRKNRKQCLKLPALPEYDEN